MAQLPSAVAATHVSVLLPCILSCHSSIDKLALFPPPPPPFSQGLSTIVRALPGPQPAVLLAVQRTLQRCSELLQVGGGGDSALRLAGVGLFGAAAAQLPAVHIALLEGYKAAMEECVVGVAGHAADVAAELCDTLFEVVSHSDDLLRKPGLVRWYQRLASSVTLQQRQAGGKMTSIRPGAVMAA
jgi:hypothetical protein